MSELKRQLVSALLVVLTVAACVAAVINFQQQGKFHLPDDGVTWLHPPDRTTPAEVLDPKQTRLERPVAVHISPGSPAEKAGIRAGDRLVSIDGVQIGRASEA